VAQSVKHLTLDFGTGHDLRVGTGHDLRVVRPSPALGYALSKEPT